MSMPSKIIPFYISFSMTTKEEDDTNGHRWRGGSVNGSHK